MKDWKKYLLGYCLIAVLVLPVQAQILQIGSGTSLENYAASELQRYYYQLSGKLLNIERTASANLKSMFGCAMRKVNGCEDCRVPAFNAQYAWARTMLTTILIADTLCAFRFYNEWQFWPIAMILLIISWNRFKERGYYYAREVLNEYLKRTDKKE